MSCDPFYIENVSSKFKEKVLEELERIGATIKTQNPWEIELNQHGVELNVEWDEFNQVLKVSVVKKNIYVGCNKIEKNIVKILDGLRPSIDNPSL